MTDVKQLLKELEHFANGQHMHYAFNDLLDWALLPFKKWDNADDQSQALVRYKSHPKVTQLVSLITLIGDLSEGFSDPLGEVYMQAISNGHNGQYFTPEPICSMISAMTMDENSQPGQTVSDCACGSGRMLLAAAKTNRHLCFYGADLDNTCCKMALLNLLLNSMSGEIAHMNTLSNEFYTGYKVNTTLFNGYHMPYYTEFREPGLSYIWLRPTSKVKPKQSFTTPFEPVRAIYPTNRVQPSLF